MSIAARVDSYRLEKLAAAAHADVLAAYDAHGVDAPESIAAYEAWQKATRAVRQARKLGGFAA